MNKELKGQKREKKQYIDNLKEIKGIVYGKEIKDNILLSVVYADFDKFYTEFGKSTVFSLDIDEEKNDVVIKDIQIDPRTDRIAHIDFYAVVKGETMEVRIPFEFIGESEAVKQGGVLNTQLNEILVKSLPKDIPHSIEIDLTKLENSGDAIRLEDIKLPAGVEFLTENLEEVIVSIMEAVSAEDEMDDEAPELNTEEENKEGEEKKEEEK